MQKKLDLNVIQVGTELFSGSDALEIEYAIVTVRWTLGSVDIGIGKVQRFGIPLDAAGGHEHIDSDAEASALLEEWGFPGKAVDVFFVRSYAGTTVGISPFIGSCKHGDEPDSGVVVAIEHSRRITALTVAHELSHYLGLFHAPDSENLMFKNVPNGGELTPEQGEKMKRHCIVYTGCRPK